MHFEGHRSLDASRLTRDGTARLRDEPFADAAVWRDGRRALEGPAARPAGARAPAQIVCVRPRFCLFSHSVRGWK